MRCIPTSWDFPTGTAKNPCWDSDCSQPFTKGLPCSNGKSFKLLKEEEQKYVYMDTAAALVKDRSSHSLFSVPGLATRMVRHDGLHALFVRGVCSHLVGSIVHFLCYFDGKQKQSVKPTDRLALIFDQVQSGSCKTHQSETIDDHRPKKICKAGLQGS